MSEQPVKKRKINGRMIFCIIISLSIMEYSLFKSTDSTLFWKLAIGVLTYGTCFIGAAALTLFLWLGMYVANLFFNEIYNESKEAPSWENTDLIMFVFFVILYISVLAGWIKL